MELQGEFEEEHGPHQEPEPWRAPMRCPECHGIQTRFVTMNYEMSVYECELCGAEFEVEDDA